MDTLLAVSQGSKPEADLVHNEIKQQKGHWAAPRPFPQSSPLHYLAFPSALPFFLSLSLQGFGPLKGFSSNKPILREWQGQGRMRRTSRLKGKERREDVDCSSRTVLLTNAAVFRIDCTVGRKYYSDLIVGTVHIMNQLLEEAEGVITDSVRPYSGKHRPFYHRLQTFQTNSRLLKTPLQNSAAVGTNVLLYLPCLLLMNPLANTRLGITAPVQSFSVIFTLVKYSLLFQVFRTIVENGHGESMMSDAKFRKLTQTLVSEVRDW